MNELLAKIGVSLKESKEPYASRWALLRRYGFLPLKVRLELAQRLQSVSDAFPIDGLYYDSFLRRYGAR